MKRGNGVFLLGVSLVRFEDVSLITTNGDDHCQRTLKYSMYMNVVSWGKVWGGGGQCSESVNRVGG